MPGIVSYQFLNSNGEIISNQNPDMLLMPASNMKIVSGYGAYSILGRDYLFNTDFSIKGNTLQVSGDPTFLLSGPKLQEICNRIRERNPHIERLVLDTSCIDSKPYGSSWMIGDRKYTYQSKISPFSVNEGSIPPDLSDLEGLNDPHGEKMKPAQNQVKFFSQVLWKGLGLDGEAKYSTGKIEETTPVFTYSTRLEEVLTHIESVSCNFSIEVLTKLLSHKLDGKTGTWKRSIKAIYGVMKNLGLNIDEIKIEDGSGLSRLNLLSTGFLSNLIYRISRSDDSEFIKLLPQTGIGTLQKRLHDLDELSIHAKTGSIEYCSSLSGYVDKLGISFSVIINHFTEKDENLPNVVDEIIRENLPQLTS